MSELTARLGRGILLWRGGDLRGRDIDLLVLPEAQAELGRILPRAGLRPSPRGSGRTVWSWPGGEGPVIDVMPSEAWADHYPSLAGVLARAWSRDGLPPRTSPEDRLLILGAELIAGRPIDKTLRRARPMLESPDCRNRLEAVATKEQMLPVAQLIGRPDRVASLARRGRLPYLHAASAAVRCAPARAALSVRLRSRLLSLFRSGVPGVDRSRGRRAFLIAISGMDGAGKSTAAEAVRGQVERAQRPAIVTWGRLGTHLGSLDAVASVVKRVLRRERTIADPVATGGASTRKQRHPGEIGRRRPLVSWAWVVVVAAIHARYLRRAARPRLTGTTVVCDRSLVDSLVDLELRYGRHRLAEILLSKAAPSPDLGILLDVDAATAADRKRGDQAARILVGMERRYLATAGRHGFIVVDARVGLEETHRSVERLVESLLASRDEPRTPEQPSGTGLSKLATRLRGRGRQAS